MELLSAGKNRFQNDEFHLQIAIVIFCFCLTLLKNLLQVPFIAILLQIDLHIYYELIFHIF